MAEKPQTIARIDVTLTGDLAELFLRRKEEDGDESNNALAKRLIRKKLAEDNEQRPVTAAA